MKIYLLQAKGTSGMFTGTRTILCQTAFLSRTVAEAASEAFKSKCCGGDMFDLDLAGTVVRVLELDLDETTP